MSDSDDPPEDKPNGDAVSHGMWAWLQRATIRVNKKRKTDNEFEQPPDRAANWTAIGTAVIAAFTIALSLVSFYQLREMREAGKQTDNLICLYGQQVAQLTKQATAAVDAANAAKSAAGIAREQMVLDTRPWINLIPGLGVPEIGDLAPNTAIGIQFTISNPGKTAAVDLKWETFNQLVRPGQFIEPRYVPMDAKLTTKMYPAGSSTPNVTLRGKTIHPARENQSWQGRKTWEELAIRITYLDVIDATHPVHVTESCIFVIYSDAASQQCPTHNTQN